MATKQLGTVKKTILFLEKGGRLKSWTRVGHWGKKMRIFLVKLFHPPLFSSWNVFHKGRDCFSTSTARVEFLSWAWTSSTTNLKNQILTNFETYWSNILKKLEKNSADLFNCPFNSHFQPNVFSKQLTKSAQFPSQLTTPPSPPNLAAPPWASSAGDCSGRPRAPPPRKARWPPRLWWWPRWSRRTGRWHPASPGVFHRPKTLENNPAGQTTSLKNWKKHGET